MFSRLFALMNDHNRFVVSCKCFSSLSSMFPKLFPMFVQSSLFCLFMAFVSSALHYY